MTKDKIGEIGRGPESAASLTRRPYPRNPIGVIALFVSFIEVISTISLKLLLDAGSPYAVYVVFFFIGFPSLLSIMFFGTLWFRRESLYSPSDFREDASFVQLLERFEMVEIRQKAAQLDPAGDPDDFFALIPELLVKNDLKTIVTLGRGFLKVRRYSKALEVFDRLSGLHLSRELRLQVIEFTAYSLNGLGRYGDSLQQLKELTKLAPKESERFWPALAFSYAHFKLGNQEEFRTWLEKAKKAVVVYEDLNLAFNIYPDFRAYLTEQDSSRLETGK